MITYFLSLGILLDHAHLISPIAVAWSTPSFRQVMYRKAGKFIALPLALIVFGLLFGCLVPRHALAFNVLIGVSMVWNAYHFGAQNFGLLALWGRRHLGFALFCVTPLLMAVLPLTHFGGTVTAWVLMEIVAFSHWISSIWLSAFASKYRWWFLFGVLAVSPFGFLFKYAEGSRVMLYGLPVLLSLRMCIGFDHFLYDRWIWKFSDPQVRATIGKELFA